MWWRRRSLRARITVLAAVALAAALLAGSALFTVVLRVSLVGAVDDRLRQRSAEVERLVAEDALPTQLAGSDRALAVQVLSPEGGVQAASVDASRVVPLLSPPEVESAVRRGGPAFLGGDRTGYGDRLRVLATRTERGPVVVVAVPVTAQNDSLRVVRLALALGVPVLLAGLAGAVWLTVGRTLRPVDELRAGAEAVSAREPSRRLPVPSARDEVQRLARTLNGMLDRLEAGAQQQRAFVADAAHELRSPLAALRTELEVSLAHPDAAGHEQQSAAALNEVLRMSRLVDDLLLLARLDGSTRAHSVDVDLAEVARAVAPAAGPDAHVALTLGFAPVYGDPDALARVVRNLVDNAARHTNGVIEVRTHRANEMVELIVDDDGPGIPAGERERVFDRFARVDSPRSRDAGGTGLGLAIVRQIVTAHGGTVRAEQRPGGGARLVVRLPAA